jgi:hypothetical protein
MDKQTRDVYGLINAHHILLQALYTEVLRNDATAYQRLEADILRHLESLPQGQYEPIQFVQIKSQTQDAVKSFLANVHKAARH